MGMSERDRRKAKMAQDSFRAQSKAAARHRRAIERAQRAAAKKRRKKDG